MLDALILVLHTDDCFQNLNPRVISRSLEAFFALNFRDWILEISRRENASSIDLLAY